MRNITPLFLIAGLTWLASNAGQTFALTPDSPEVKALVKKGLDFLERGGGGGPQMAIGAERTGEKVLVGLAFLKAGKPEHAFVKEAVQVASRGIPEDNYTLGLCIMLLTELDEKQQNKEHLPTIQKLADEFVSRQQPSGAFGYYPNDGKGDTSQMQYAALGLWNAKYAGAKFPQATVERLLDFLIRVQDPTGSWCYNGTDPGSYQRVNQVGVSHSLTAAGLGAVCICADMLGINQRRNDEEVPEETGLPTALKVMKKAKAQLPAEAAPDTKIDPALVDRAIKDGERWLTQNYKIETGVPWNYYYLYGLERAEAYREWYFTKRLAKEPKWYNDGVAFLARRNQAGGWAGDHSAKVSTSFAILFLLRSSYKVIVAKNDLGEGVLTSGKGLPTDLSQVSVKRGKVIDSALAAEAEDLTELLNDPDNPELTRILENNEDFKLDADSTKRSNQIVQLRNLVSAGNWEARMLAVRGLGKVRDLDNVPSLLFALTDPDGRVVSEADNALRFISRKLQGVGMPADPDTKTPEGRKEIEAARKVWREWYLSIRPDAELID
jgi:hypothetical protein